MRTIWTIILLICFFYPQAQTVLADPSLSESKRVFKNQGEQEDYWAEQLFEKDYKKQVFKKYKGKIVQNSDGFKYADQSLVVVDIPEEQRTIFAKGILYPAIIIGALTAKTKSKQDFHKMTEQERSVNGWVRTDSLTISHFQQLPSLSKSMTEKRFRFWLYRQGFRNQQVCFVELTNKRATIKTDLLTFISGAVLTFYKTGWMVI